MSNKKAHESLHAAALARAAKQFPDHDPNEVVKAVEEQHAALIGSRPLVDKPMRDLRTTALRHEF